MSIIRKSIGGLISDIAQTNSDRNALVHAEAGQRYSYQDLVHEVDRAARGFLNLGIRPGDKIALWSANVPEWMIAFLGLAKLGAITVPIDPAAATDNLYYILEQSESRGLIVADRDDSRDMLSKTRRPASRQAAVGNSVLLWALPTVDRSRRSATQARTS